MAKTETRKVVFQFAAELAIVVIGVLLAFQIDRWRDQHASAETEMLHLNALKVDFETIKENYEATLSGQEEILRLSEFTLRASRNADMFSSAHSDSLRNAILYATAWYDPETVMGTYDALTASGNVGILSNRDLRRLLAQFYGQVSAGFEDRETTMDLIAMLFAESKDHLRGVVADDWEGDLEWYSTTSVSQADLRAIYSDDGFMGLLSQKIMLDRNKRGWLAVRIYEIDSILAALDSLIQE